MTHKTEVLTFILGNGFDIANDMKTGYYDFYKWYIDQPSESADEDKMKKSIKRYVDNKRGTWTDFELALGQYTKEFSDAERFKKCFISARDALVRYLREEYNRNLSANKDFLKSATYRLIELSQKSDWDIPEEQKDRFFIPADVHLEFNCISFNYTPVVQDGLKDMKENSIGISARDNWAGRYTVGEMINVHGTLHDTPVLGVDNVGQIANKSFRTNPEITELMVKGEIDRKLGRGWRKKATQIIQKSDKLYVFGASLGDTDEFWWRTLARWFELDPERHQLAVFCRPDSDEIKMRNKIESMIDKISRHFSNKEYKKAIAIDSTAKTMTVKFAYMSANSTIKIKTEAKLEVVAAKSISLS